MKQTKRRIKVFAVLALSIAFCGIHSTKVQIQKKSGSVSSPEKKVLFLNLNTARNLYIYVPTEILASARVFGRES